MCVGLRQDGMCSLPPPAGTRGRRASLHGGRPQGTAQNTLGGREGGKKGVDGASKGGATQADGPQASCAPVFLVFEEILV